MNPLNISVDFAENNKNFLKEILGADDIYVVGETPKMLDIELSSVCNLRCSFCFLSNPDYKVKGGYMPRKMAYKLIDEAADIGVENLKFNWRGESTLHPHITDIVKYAYKKKKFKELLLNTNGQKYVPAFKYLTRVFFSADSFYKETYEKIRRGGSLPKLISTIFRTIKDAPALPEVRRVICDENKHEDFAKDAKYIFGGSVKIKEHICFDRSKLTKFNAPRIYCGQPSERLIVSVEGDIYPCCVGYGAGDLRIGNIKDMTLLQAWHSEKLKDIQEKLMKNNFSKLPTCENCTSYSAYDCAEKELLKL